MALTNSAATFGDALELCKGRLSQTNEASDEALKSEILSAIRHEGEQMAELPWFLLQEHEMVYEGKIEAGSVDLKTLPGFIKFNRRVPPRIGDKTLMRDLYGEYREFVESVDYRDWYSWLAGYDYEGYAVDRDVLYFHLNGEGVEPPVSLTISYYKHTDLPQQDSDTNPWFQNAMEYVVSVACFKLSALYAQDGLLVNPFAAQVQFHKRELRNRIAAREIGD